MPMVVFTTAPKGKGKEIARTLVERRVAACVNVVSGVSSFYWWEGKLEADEEDLIIVKTCEEALGELEGVVREIHPYSVPELIAVPIVRGLKEYLDWVCKEVRTGGSSAGGGGKP